MNISTLDRPSLISKHDELDDDDHGEDRGMEPSIFLF